MNKTAAKLINLTYTNPVYKNTEKKIQRKLKIFDSQCILKKDIINLRIMKTFSISVS